MIALSPYHHVELAEELVFLLSHPPRFDQVLRTISRKEVNGQPLITGELVLAGSETLKAFPAAQDFPVHFRKTYYPTCFHRDPRIELANHERAADLIGVPKPIGAAPRTFRSCFIPGVPLSKFSPFGAEPESANLKIGQDAELGILVALWNLLVSVDEKIRRLHTGGLVHGDMFLHNAIVSTSPLETFLIDFEQSGLRDEHETEEAWEEACRKDREQIFREAVFVQATLGRQRGRLAEDSLAAAGRTFDDGERFIRAIEANTGMRLG